MTTATITTSGFEDMADDLDFTGEAPVAATGPVVFSEPCKPCRGTGQFWSYMGRLVGHCFSCKGTGKHEYKTSPQHRAKARQQREAREAREASARVSAADAWMAANPAEAGWIKANEGRNDFALSMRNAVTKYGHLTENQLRAVRNAIVRDEARAAERAAAATARAAAAPVVDTTAMEGLFANATGNGLKSPAVRIAGFKFKPAKATSANAGALYVTDDEGEYMGKVMGGRFLAARECTPAKAEQIVAACANPKDALVRYGRELGSCGLCGRTLVDPVSIEAGIGPICAEKFGL